MNKEEGIAQLQVNVELKELLKEEKWPDIVAYVFNRSGRLLSRQPLKSDEKKPTTGRANFKIETMQTNLVVKVGPDIDDIRTLERYQPVVKSILVGHKAVLEFELAKSFWICWLKIPYHVTGTVKKQKPGPDAPICAGEVDIYDVDIEYCLLALSDSIIERIRDSIIDIVVDPPLIDPPQIDLERPLVWWDWEEDDWCGTGPKPPFPGRPVDVTEKLASLPPAWAFAKQRYEAIPTARARINTMMKAMSVAEKRTLLNAEAVEGVIVSQVLYSNTTQFRNMLIDKFQVFRFWLCWWPWIYWLWWPYCGYSLEKLGTAELQADGSFSKTVPLSVCRHDKPDLWFVVRQKINGIERVIYARHPVPCNTYWNHPSGKPVHLVVTDPNAVACHPPIPGTADPYVMPTGIYEDEWYQVNHAHIKSSCVPGLPLPAQCGLYNSTDPYGTRLDLRMQFHDQVRNILPPNNGVRYYRWSFRKHGTANWTHINTPIIHRYLTAVAPGTYVIDSETLGPNHVGGVGGENNLFSVPDPNRSWLDNRNDLAYAVWYTAIRDGNRYIPQVPDGKYDLRLEVFDKSGTKLKPAAGFKYILQTGPVGPVDNNLFVESDGSLVLHLHIDNRDTFADIQSIALNGAKVSDCQFLEYTNKNTDTADIEYLAYHPAMSHNFLHHYKLTVRRGISGTIVASESETAPATTPATKKYTIVDLLGTYKQCSFAVWLHTWPRTRDGHGPIRAYEDSDTTSFALVKNKPNQP